ncbi:hypothetical protein ACFW6F_41110 [Streptomyces sp. NPDC058746]|uniref:hypothetical protein n=1 Tax=Streptomyces sp. NPDC058746 TaxID=3346622 RepID=UPI00369B028F
MVMVHLLNKAADMYLAGDYASGKTILRDRGAEGTLWEMNDLGASQFTFLNLQDLDRSNWLDVVQAMSENRYLDGNTVTGTVQLVPHLGEPYSGTRWLRSPVDNSFVFNCLGVADGWRILDGRPIEKTIQLMANSEFAGTRWFIEVPV